jgi:hypothetical protein
MANNIRDRLKRMAVELSNESLELLSQDPTEHEIGFGRIELIQKDLCDSGYQRIMVDSPPYRKMNQVLNDFGHAFVILASEISGLPQGEGIFKEGCVFVYIKK